MQRGLIPVAVVSAVCGCAAAVGLVAAFDVGGGDTTTLVQEAPLIGSATASTSQGRLTARDIFKRNAAGVVYVRAEVVRRSPSAFEFSLPEEQRTEATGSGFVIDRDGTILTNAHVIAGARRVTVQFQDKQVVEAKILGRDESTDLALLKVEPKDGLDIRPLALGSVRNVQVGDPAIAIGNPFGLERTLTTGVISALKRPITGPNGFVIDDAIQTDAPINPGNSGGPLIDATGRVIGINSQIQTGGNGNGNVGIGFAIPIDTARPIIRQLKAQGRVDRGFLGVEALSIDKSLEQLDLPVERGVLVQSVEPGGPAEKAGIRGGNIAAQLDGNPIQLGGDIITRVDDRAIRTSDDLTTAVAGRKPGDKVAVTIQRGDTSKVVEVTLGERPASAPDQP